jgi:cytochrome c peroxidase
MRPTITLVLLLAAIAAAQDDDPAPKSARPTPRPAKSAAEAADFAAGLRAAYAKPAADWPKPTIDPGVAYAELGLLPAVAYPKDNPFSPAKDDLGKVLFFDARLSGSKQIACASCHDPDLGWADGRTASFGHGRTLLKRNAPPVQNAAFGTAFFWDGRADSLEQQAHAVLLNPDEMRGGKDDIVDALAKSKGYLKLFEKAFGTPEVTWDRVAQAVATFERGVKGGSSRFDAFVRGKGTLSDAEVRGLHLFRTDARCANCHLGPTLSDGKFHDLGLSGYGQRHEDLGRYAVTKKAEDVGRFKTPSLRNVGRTGPYMHHGLFELDTALNLYNAGGFTVRKPAKLPADAPPFPTKDPLLKVLNLNKDDLADLKAFLLTLDEPRRIVRPPELPALGDAP